jgi:hypothetical protein
MAGATEEMVAAACLLFGSLPREAPGRPRKYKNGKEARHAYYVRHRDRLKKNGGISSKKAPNGEDTHVLTLDEVKAIHAPVSEPLALARKHADAIGHMLTGARVPSLKGKLVDAARWNVDREADVDVARQSG